MRRIDWKKIVAAVPVVAVLVVILEPFGFIGTKWACAVDGGLIVEQSIEGGGFYDRSPQRDYCVLCVLVLNHRFFDYSEAYTKHTGPRISEPGFYRYRIADKGDPDCAGWIRRANRYSAPDHSECITVEKIQSPTARYWFLSSHRATRSLVELTRIERRLTDSTDGSLVARYVHYGYVPWADKFFDSRSFQWECDQEIPWISSVQFFERVSASREIPEEESG